MTNQPDKPMRVAVASLTRQRPAMFGEMLDSLASLQWPGNVTPVFIFVENDRQLTIEGQVDRLHAAVPGAEIYTECEPQLGIPVARNRVLDIALAHDVDYLAFLDDDELVAPDWIERLLFWVGQGNLDLVGGPLDLVRPDATLTKSQMQVWDFLVAKNAARIERAHFLDVTDRQGQIRLFTNNWMVSTDFLRRSGLRFDEKMGLSGGSDTRFYVQSKELNAVTGWAFDALVYDRIPLSRLQVSYQFRRARDQNMALYFIDGQYLEPFARLRAVLTLLMRILRYGLKIVASYFRGGRGYVLAWTKIGASLGRVYAAFGRRSKHYAAVTASH